MEGRYKVTFLTDGKVTYEFRTDYKAVAINTALHHNHGPHWCKPVKVVVVDTKTGKKLIK